MPITSQKDLIAAMEPLATHAPIITLTDAGQEALSAASTAISTKRIADILTGMVKALHRQGDITDDEMKLMGVEL